MNQMCRNLIKADWRAALLAKLSDKMAIVAVYLERYLQVNISQLVCRGKCRCQVENCGERNRNAHGGAGAADIKDYRGPGFAARDLQIFSGIVGLSAIIDPAQIMHRFNSGPYPLVGRI